MANILVVEDDKLLGREIATALTEGGHTVVWIKSSEEFEQALLENAFSLIYLDIMLPGTKDGYALLKELKEMEDRKNIPVVMLSNLGQINEMQRAMDLGAMDYLIKANIDLDKLLDLTNNKFLK